MKMSVLLTAKRITEPPGDLVCRSGKVIGHFDHRTQDSGNISWAVETDDGRLFVKTAGTLSPTPADAPVPYLDHAGRVNLLRNAAELARSCSHPCLARLQNVIESPLGPALVYDYAPGQLRQALTADTTRDRRTNASPTSQPINNSAISTASSAPITSWPRPVGSPATSTTAP